MASNYLNNSLSPSFSEKVITEFAIPAAESSPFLESYLEKFPTISEATEDIYENGLQGLDSLEGFLPKEGESTESLPQPSAGWTFITAPEDISWDIANQANRVDIFGTNNPPLIAGSRGMRDITLSNSLVEGFLRNVTVESKVASLEDLMNYRLNDTDGFVSIPVYQLWANKKSYGGPEAYYIIKDVKVRETMRDIKGDATRAYVDISLMQVPAYQVNTGRDQASTVTAGGQVRTNPVAPGGNSQSNQKVQGSTQKGGASATNANTKPAAGPGTPKPAAPVGALDLNTPRQIVPRSGSNP